MPLPRIPPEELERIKREIPVQRLAEARGIKLKAMGKDLVGLCPFHEEKTESLHITPATNIWHCFGCNKGGSNIDWVIEAEGVSVRHAMEILREGLIPQGEFSGKITKKATIPKLSSPVSLNAEDRELMKQVITYYHETLKKSPEGLAYLEKRGLQNSEMIDRFKIGYANRTLGLRLPESNRKEGAAIRERLQKIGLYRETGREHFCGAIVFPVFDESGAVSEIYGRKTCHKLTPGLAYHMYLPGPHKGVFNFEALKASKDIILCEAIIDALTFWCAGFRNVTASYGVNGFTSDHLEAFKKYGVERVYIAYDRDNAGDKAAEELSQKLIAEGFECFRILFPRDMDANEYAQKVKPPEKSLDLVFRNATWLGKGSRSQARLPVPSKEEPKAATKGEKQTGDGSKETGEAKESLNEQQKPGIDRVAESNGIVIGSLRDPERASEKGIVQTERPDSKNGNSDSGESGGEESQPKPEGFHSKPDHSSGQPVGSGDSSFSRPRPGTFAKNADETAVSSDCGNPRIPPAIDSKPSPRVTIQGTTSQEPATNPPDCIVNDAEIIIRMNDRRWRIRGLAKNMSYDQLKVNLLVSIGERFYVDTFDLYSARCRAVFTKQASEELRLKEETVKLDLGRVLLKLEELQDKQIKETLEPREKEVVLTPEEKAEAMELLTDPRLLNRILSDFEKCGIVGEETNKLVGYLASVSRKLEMPLGIIIQSSSAAGKTALMEAVLAFMPEEEKIKYSAMTGQSLFYMGETNLKHKILAIVEEEGAERASYALKLLLSEGVLTIASTGKDPQTGRLITHEYRVEGPTMIFVTTTNIDIKEELQNRCIMLAVDESREQTRAIHQIQREMRTLEGLIARKQKAKLLKLHQNAQRLLKPIYVLNRFARRLTFLDDQMRTRRDNKKYLSLIESITLLHQYQRPLKTAGPTGEPLQCLEVTLDDIETANKLMDAVLGHSLDELPPQTRRFLMLLEDMVKKTCERLNIERSEYRFHRRDILDFTGWSYNQLRIHMERLIDLEYVLIHRGQQGQRFSYELLYDGKGKDGKRFCLGLLDPEAIKREKSVDTISTLWGQNKTLLGRTGDFVPPLSHGCSPVVGGVLGQANEDRKSVSGQKTENFEKNAHMRIPPQLPSYPQVRHNGTFLLAAKETGNGSKSLLRGVV